MIQLPRNKKHESPHKDKVGTPGFGRKQRQEQAICLGQSTEVSVGKVGRKRVNSVGWAIMNNFLGFGYGVFPSCLASGPGMIKAGEYCLLGCMGQ